MTRFRCLMLLLTTVALTGCTTSLSSFTPSTPPTSTFPTPTASITGTIASASPTVPARQIAESRNLAYGPAKPGNLLDLFVPEVPGDAALPLVIWNSGSAFLTSDVKAFGGEVTVVEELTSRGYAVASISIRSSADARFPAQGFDVRAAIRYLRANADRYGIDPGQIAVMGESSGGWAATFAAATSDTLELDGETGVNGISSAVRVAAAFFPPTDFLSMDAQAEASKVPMVRFYPMDSPTSPVGLLIACPGEGPDEGSPDPDALLSIRDCPDDTRKADPASYIDGDEVPIWLLHGLADDQVPSGQSRHVYDATTAAGNEARLTLVPGAGHSVEDIIGAAEATTWATSRGGQQVETTGPGPSWDDIEQFLHAHLP